jgi:hypothetical protein
MSFLLLHSWILAVFFFFFKLKMINLIGEDSVTQIPNLENSLCTHHHKSKAGKVLKFFKIVGLAMRTMISALLGDPSALIVGITEALMSYDD